MLAIALTLFLTPRGDDTGTAFKSERYGLWLSLPRGWTILKREQNDLVFAARVPSGDAQNGGLLLCELGLAPESLHEWRTRIDKLAETGRLKGLTRNEVVSTAQGERHVTLVEFPLGPDELFLEHTVRVAANRQLYSFKLRVDSNTYPRVRPQLDALLDSVTFTPPETGTELLDRATNRWQQTEFKLAIDLPGGWAPVLAPSEVVLFYANGPAHGIWSDNCLIVARPHGTETLEQLQDTLPARIKQEDPNCEIVRCQLVKQGDSDALETIVRTQRGPFSMTVIERRFRGRRFDYESKYTVETQRFDDLLPALRKSLDSFEELPGDVPRAGKAA